MVSIDNVSVPRSDFSGLFSAFFERLTSFDIHHVDRNSSVLNGHGLVHAAYSRDEFKNDIILGLDNERLDTASVFFEAVMRVRSDRHLKFVADIHHPAFDLRFVVSEDSSNCRQYPPIFVVCLLILFEQ